MPTGWRIVKEKYANSAFDGEGARINGGRWNSVGTPCVYSAESISLAVLEIIVQTEAEALLPSYLLIPVSFNENVVSPLDTSVLPDDWPESVAMAQTQSIGDEWVESAQSVVLRVPSAVTGMEWNYLFNPRHSGFAQLEIGEPKKIPIDPRLRT